MNLTNKQIEAIKDEANSAETIKHCEPNIFCPQMVQGWQVIRVLQAYEKVRNAEMENIERRLEKGE